MARRPELLAPAGEWEALRAAVANGADACYFGLEALNARRRATNFTVVELPAVMTYLHDHNVHGYVTLNTLVFPGELAAVARYAEALAAAGADAVIVQDLGVLRLLRRMVPSLAIHASTQLTQTEGRGIEVLRALGVQRVIVARELTLAELTEIQRHTPMELEVFVHGALCISYSGQCLASEALWGRSANRGECGQACRLPYEFVVDGRPCPPRTGPYPLSAQDLAAYERLPELVRLGIAGFKIEGRLKSAHYVAAATRVYRAALDAALAHEPFALSPAQQAELAQSFSRGFTGGYLGGINHQTLVHGQYAKKRGVCVGTVAGTTRQGVIVRLAEGDARRGRGGAGGAPWPLKPGDGVVFDEGHPERDEQGGRVYTVRPAGANAQPGQLEVGFAPGDVNLAAVSAGCRVWKTDDPHIRRRLEQSYGRDLVMRRVPLHVQVRAGEGERLVLGLCPEDGPAVAVESDDVLARASKHPLTVELVRAQLGRLGDTPFELASVTLEGARGPADSLPVMVPKSVLNELRRRGVRALREQRAASRRHVIAAGDVLADLRVEAQAVGRGDVRDETGQDRAAQDARPRAAVLVRRDEQLRAVLGWPRPADLGPLTVYADYVGTGDYRRVVELCRTAGCPVALATPMVLMPGEEGVLEQICAARPDAVLVRTLGALAYFRDAVPRVPLIGDTALNIVNEAAASEVLQRGMVRVTPGYDLRPEARRALLAALGGGRIEIVVYRYAPLFHTRYCLYAATLSAAERCGQCGQRCASHTLALRSRGQGTWPVMADACGRNVVYRDGAESAFGEIGGLVGGGVRVLRIELLSEGGPAATALLDRLAGGIRSAEAADSAPKTGGGAVIGAEGNL